MSNLPAELIDAATRVLDANRALGRRVAVAESCTGGLVAAALTEIAGSSDVFDAGFVTYSNEAKEELLDVSGDVIETFGAAYISVPYKDGFAFLVLILFLVFRPQGIFGERVAEKV